MLLPSLLEIDTFITSSTKGEITGTRESTTPTKFGVLFEDTFQWAGGHHTTLDDTIDNTYLRNRVYIIYDDTLQC